MTVKPRLVLASNSPRRRELLSLLGWQFVVRPAHVDETPRRGETAVQYVGRLAEEKARMCELEARVGETIIAADTTVLLAGEILGKPQDAKEAASMLRRLRGRTHQVCTAIAVLDVAGGGFFPDTCLTEVPMRNYLNQELRDYVASGDPLDKAGGYAIQDPVFNPVERLRGCYASVMGLPLCLLGRTLEKAGLAPPGDYMRACQVKLHYHCPIHARVRNGEEIG